MYRIVTHPGNAHKDDFIAVSILLAILGEATVCRREATADDLAESNTYVVDVGMELNPERHNFDHHQDRSLPCAFHLLMKHLGHHDKALKVYGWYTHMSMMDVRGAQSVAEHLGVDIEVLFASSSPIDGFILSRFSAVESMQAGDLIYELMRDFGQDFLAMMDKKVERLALLEEQTEIVPVGDFKVLVSRIADNPKLSMELYLRRANDPAIVVAIFPSNRGAGWELLRLGNNPQVDFRLVAADPQIRFVHFNGFMAKTRRQMPLVEVLPLVTTAIGGV
jgi:hypothetical protein